MIYRLEEVVERAIQDALSSWNPDKDGWDWHFGTIVARAVAEEMVRRVEFRHGKSEADHFRCAYGLEEE